MSAAPPKKKRDNAPLVVPSPGGFQQKFRAFVSYLAGEEKKQSRNVREQIHAEYKLWRDQFEYLSTQFEGVWRLFGELEKEIPGWYRTPPHSGKWGYLDITRGGYTFGAVLERNHRKNAAYGEKWIKVSFGMVSEYGAGVGDERMIGFPDDPSAKPAGLHRCKMDNMNQQLENLQRMRKRIASPKLMVGIHHHKIDQKNRSLDLDVLRRGNLRTFTEHLFLLLHRNEISSLTNALSGPEETLALPFDTPEKKSSVLSL